MKLLKLRIELYQLGGRSGARGNAGVCGRALARRCNVAVLGVQNTRAKDRRFSMVRLKCQFPGSYDVGNVRMPYFEPVHLCKFCIVRVLYHDVGVKRLFDPFDTRLFRTTCSHNLQKHSQSAHFSLKNGYLLMFLAGPKVKNSPASKLASDF